MANIQLVDSKTHQNCRVMSGYKAELGYNLGAIMVLPGEIKDIQREYPIILRKDPETGEFFPNALLGFKADENLFIDNEGSWTASYIPLAIKKGPFMIGRQKSDGDVNSDLHVYIDMDDPRVNDEDGEQLFENDGELTKYMQSSSQILFALHNGYSDIKKMVAAFSEANLIEPIKVEIAFSSGKKINFGGAYTIAEEKLAALSSEQLASLNSQGFLASAFYISHSVANFQRLIDIKNNAEKYRNT